MTSFGNTPRFGGGTAVEPGRIETKRRGCGMYRVLEYEIKRNTKLEEIKAEKSWQEEKAEYIKRYQTHIVKITSLRQDVRQAMGEVQRLRLENMELRNQQGTTAAAFASKEAGIQAGHAATKAELVTALTKVDVLQSDLEAAATRANEDAAKISDFQVELQRAKLGSRLSDQARGETEGRLISRIEDAMQELATRKQDNHELRLRLRTTETSLKAEAIGNEEGSRQVAVLSETVAEYESRIIDLETAVGQAKDRGLRLTTQSDRTSKELIAMTECEKAVSSTNQVLMEMNGELEQRLVDLAERYMALDSENNQNVGLAEQGQQMEEFAHALQGKHDALIQTHVETTEALQAEIERLNKRLSEFEKLARFREGVAGLMNN